MSDNLFFLFCCERDNGGGMADYAGSFATLEDAWKEYRSIGRDWADIAILEGNDLKLFAASSENIVHMGNGHRRIDKGWQLQADERFIIMESREQRPITKQPAMVSQPNTWPAASGMFFYATGVALTYWEDV